MDIVNNMYRAVNTYAVHRINHYMLSGVCVFEQLLISCFAFSVRTVFRVARLDDIYSDHIIVAIGQFAQTNRPARDLQCAQSSVVFLWVYAGVIYVEVCAFLSVCVCVVWCECQLGK